jgi:hypothetical protein
LISSLPILEERSKTEQTYQGKLNIAIAPAGICQHHRRYTEDRHRPDRRRCSNKPAPHQDQYHVGHYGIESNQRAHRGDVIAKQVDACRQLEVEEGGMLTKGGGE